MGVAEGGERRADGADGAFAWDAAPAAGENDEIAGLVVDGTYFDRGIC